MKVAKLAFCFTLLAAATYATPTLFKGKVMGILPSEFSPRAGISIPIEDGVDHVRVLVRPIDAAANRDKFVLTLWGSEPDSGGPFVLSDDEVKSPGLAAVVDITMPPPTLRVIVLGSGLYDITVWGKTKDRSKMLSSWWYKKSPPIFLDGPLQHSSGLISG